MDYIIEKIYVFCDDIKAYKSFFSTIFEVDFTSESSFTLGDHDFEIIELMGHKAPIASSFKIKTSESPEDIRSRVQLFNFQNPKYTIELTHSNPAQLTDPFSLVWTVEFS
jgi:hypothetical protein